MPCCWSGRWHGPRVAALGLCLLVAACGHKSRLVDPHFVEPEGRASRSSILVTYQNLPNSVFYFREFQPFDQGHPEGPSPGDVLDHVDLVIEGDTSWVRGVIFDSTAASGYQLFRGESTGGLRQMYDFLLFPSRRWLDTGWEKYSVVDQNPSPTAPHRYLARGVTGGTVTLDAPVSNQALSPAPTLYDIPVNFAGSNDSVLVFSWPAVPGAAGYLVHFYRGRHDSRPVDQFLSGAPAPLWDGRSSDLLLAFVPSTGRPCDLGPSQVSYLTLRGSIGVVGEFLLRVSAVDCDGRFLGYTLGDFVWLPIEPGIYRASFAGAFIFPRPGASQLLASQMRGHAGLKALPHSEARVSFRYP